MFGALRTHPDWFISLNINSASTWLIPNHIVFAFSYSTVTLQIPSNLLLENGFRFYLSTIHHNHYIGWINTQDHRLTVWTGKIDSFPAIFPLNQPSDNGVLDIPGWHVSFFRTPIPLYFLLQIISTVGMLPVCSQKPGLRLCPCPCPCRCRVRPCGP